MTSGSKQDIRKKNWDRNKKRKNLEMQEDGTIFVFATFLSPTSAKKKKKSSHLYSLFCLKLDDYVRYVRDVGKYCWCIQWVSIILPRKKKTTHAKQN